MTKTPTNDNRKSRCPQYGATEDQIKDGHNKSGSQRYKCKVCGCIYTPQPQYAGYSDHIRQKAVALYRSGMSFRAIGRALGVNHQTVANWVNGHFVQPSGNDEDQGN